MCVFMYLKTQVFDLWLYFLVVIFPSVQPFSCRCLTMIYYFAMSVFSRCSETHNVLLTIECWKDVHPGLITILVDWDYKIPYALLYSKNALFDMLKFVNDAKTMFLKNKAVF